MLSHHLIDYPLMKPRYYYLLLVDVFNFIKSPKLSPNQNTSTKYKINDTIGLILLKFILLVPLVLFFAVIYDPKNVQQLSMMERFSPALMFLLGGFVLPLLEEIGFRLSLVFKPIYLALTSSVIVYYVLTKAVYHTKISMVDESFTTRVTVALLCGAILFPLYNMNSVKMRLALFWNRHFATIFYTTSIVFAWMHISKYEITNLNLLLLPILTLPQLLSAIMYGYTRVKFGFIYPLFAHMGMNIIAISLAIFSAKFYTNG